MLSHLTEGRKGGREQMAGEAGWKRKWRELKKREKRAGGVVVGGLMVQFNYQAWLVCAVVGNYTSQRQQTAPLHPIKAGTEGCGRCLFPLAVLRSPQPCTPVLFLSSSSLPSSLVPSRACRSDAPTPANFVEQAFGVHKIIAYEIRPLRGIPLSQWLKVTGLRTWVRG